MNKTNRLADDAVATVRAARDGCRRIGLLLGLALTCADVPSVTAQIGDRKNQVQLPPNADLNVPPAPVLSPEQALGKFVVPPGFRVELVAAEPLVHDPVAIAFDARGRMFVVELGAYNAEILTQLPVYLQAGQPVPPRPIGRVVMLTDTDGDGRMDKRTVFLDNLDVPRAIGFWKDKVLIGDPPNLWICSDTNGDGVADEKTLLADNFVFTDARNLQGAPNGLLWGRDNWLYNASYYWRLRFSGGKWVREPMPRLGQWGITQDDFGRLYFNSNSDQLRAGLLPPHYLAKAGSTGHLADSNFQVATDQSVWPIRPTPGVNRGYGKGYLRDNGTLVEFSAASAPMLYRGANFPARYVGNAFVPEPIAHLIKRNLLREAEGRVAAVNGYEQTDFLASTDERFRPVFVTNAPDGAMYVVDMYRGMIESYLFATTYLRDQILKRGLNQPLWGLGRIYRVVYSAGQLATRPDFAAVSPAGLVALLDDANGWTRDEAQRRIVESDRRDELVPRLRDLLQRGTTERQRIYALWCLEGLDAFTSQNLVSALEDPSPQVRMAALRAGEPQLGRADGEPVLQCLAERVASEEPIVLAQLALSLDGNGSATARNILWQLLPRAAEHPSLLDSVLLLCRARHVEVLERLAADVRGQTIPPFGSRVLLAALSTRIAIENEDAAHAALVTAIMDASVPEWCRVALMQGIVQPEIRGARKSEKADVRVLISSQRMAKLAASAPDALVRRFAGKALDGLRREDTRRARRVPAAPLTPEQTKLFTQGQAGYLICAACHQPNGLGLAGLAPPLKDGRWAAATTPEAALRIVLYGKQGTPGYPGSMVPLAALSDEQIASILTYVRRSWGNKASAVQPEDVARVRLETNGRVGAWTDSELEKFEAPAP